MVTEYKRLYRSREDRMVAGICAGLGRYFDIDPTLVRLVFVLLALIGFGGAMFVGYVVMLIVVPESPLLQKPSPPSPPTSASSEA